LRSQKNSAQAVGVDQATIDTELIGGTAIAGALA
jgi:hypothetical protein